VRNISVQLQADALCNTRKSAGVIHYSWTYVQLQ